MDKERPGTDKTESAHAFIVEDDPDSTDILTRHLEGRGLQVTGAATASDAVAFLHRDSQPDIVLLDINLPDGSGIDILADIRKTKNQSELPVILISALSQNEDIVNGLQHGANDYVVKPIEAQTLIARIEGCLSLKRSFDALVDAERQRVMLESLGAACHHIAQPLTVAVASLQLYVMELQDKQEPKSEELVNAVKCVEEAQTVIHRMQGISDYRTVPYVADMRILDFGLNGGQADGEDTPNAG